MGLVNSTPKLSANKDENIQNSTVNVNNNNTNNVRGRDSLDSGINQRGCLLHLSTKFYNNVKQL